MTTSPEPAHNVVFSDPYSYCAHPHLVACADGSWVAVFNRAPRRSVILHPPEDPYYRNVIIRSVDEGESWSAPEPVHGFGSTGMECAGLTPLPDGRLLLNQWQFEWLTKGQADQCADPNDLIRADQLINRWNASPEHDTQGLDLNEIVEQMPWARRGGRMLISFSDDFGRTFNTPQVIETAPFSGGYGMRGGIVLPNGTILLPLSDVPNYREVFLLSSRDGGQTWETPQPTCSTPEMEFEEPAIIRNPSGRLVLVMRENRSRQLHQVISDDGGASWSAPRNLGIWGYPPHLLRVLDGRVLLTFGWRSPDYGIKAIYSEHGSETWDPQSAISVRSGLPNRNLGYPSTLQRQNGTFLSMFYGEDHSGATAILSTVWR